MKSIKIQRIVYPQDLFSWDLFHTPEGNEYYEKNNFFETKCFQYVKKAAEILEELLD